MPRKKKDCSGTIRHQVQQWEIECAQIALLGREYDEAVRIFSGLVDKKFTLRAPGKEFSDRSLAVDEEARIIRLAVPYFQSLRRGDVLLLTRSAGGILVTPVEAEAVSSPGNETAAMPARPLSATSGEDRPQDPAGRVLRLQEEVIRLQQEVARLRESEYKLDECRRTLKGLLQIMGDQGGRS
jgi:hypothetical protein